MEIRLRPAEPNDSGIIAELMVSAFADKFVPVLGDRATVILQDWFQLSQRHVWTTTLADVDEQTVGFIILNLPTTSADNDERWLWQALRRQHNIAQSAYKLMWLWLLDSDHCTTVREVYIEMIGVDSTWQRKGVGQRLLSHAEALAKAKQVKWLTLSVLTDNKAALQLYNWAGFTVYRRQSHWLSGWFLRLMLGQADYFDMRKRVLD